MIKPISEKIKDLRKARSLTQDKLGEKLGVTSQAVSRWENGESMPDIMLLPQLCEILGVTADALLEVPATVKKDSCMTSIAAYAKEIGECKAAFETLQACSGDYKGSAQISNDGIKINNTSGYGLVISSAEMLASVQNTDYESIKQMCEILLDENTIKVIRTLNFDEFRSEDEIARLSNLSLEELQLSLFKLLKVNFCECDISGRYTFGVQSYVLFAVLAGLYLASPDGHPGIYSINRNYPPKE